MSMTDTIWNTMDRFRQSTLLTYTTTVGLLAITFGFSVAFHSVLGSHAPLLIFVVPVIVAAGLLGVGPALLAILFSVLIGIYLFHPPLFSFRVESPSDQFRTLAFIIVGLMITAMSEALRRSRSRSQSTHDELVHEREELRQNKQRTNLVLDAVRLGLWRADLPLNVMQWNPRGKEHLGLVGNEAFTFDQVLERIAPEHRDRVRHAFVKAIRDRGQFDVEFRTFGSCDEEECWIRAIGQVFTDAHGQPVRCDGVTVDVSHDHRLDSEVKELTTRLEQRVAERTAEAQQRTEQLRALAGELIEVEQRERRQLAQLLHDHLQQLLVAAKILLSSLTPKSSPAEVARAQHAVGDLLDQSISASRELTVQLSVPIVYDAGLGPALEWLARWMHDKHGLEVDVKADADAEPPDENVRVFLFQSVREALFNVVKHANVKQAKVELTSEDGSVVVAVEDQGVGFDPVAASRRITEGFGLTTIRERAEMFGGHLHVRSAPGQGARIEVRLPLPKRRTVPEVEGRPITPETVEEAAAEAATREGEEIRVIVADDHEILRRGLVDLLDNLPDMHVVAEASNGKEAVELAHRLHPDVMVMDATMPVMSGLEATRRIHDQMPNVHVIALTMHDNPEMASAMKSSGAEAFITKGGSTDTLVTAIRQLGARHRNGGAKAAAT